MVTVGRRWYLAAFDLRRDDWRTFRLDRLGQAQLAGVRFTPRAIPEGDAAAFVAKALSSIPRNVEATVAVDASYDEIEATLRWVDHTPLETEQNSCVIRVRTDALEWLVMAIVRVALIAPTAVVEPEAVAAEVRSLGMRLVET